MKISLKYPRNLLTKPVLSNTILKTKLNINILQAKVADSVGEYTIEIDDKDKDKFVDAIRKEGVIAEELKDSINLEREKCIDCGACVSLCPVGALVMKNFEVVVEDEKCILCRRCINSCPFKALSIKKA